MKVLTWLLILVLATPCWAAAGHEDRQEAEYYVAAYAQHYRVPVEFVRALVEQESAWRRCAISSKGAAGLMQLMPETARKLGVQDRCDLQQNISGGVRHVAYLMAKFHGDLRLVAAAYYAGEKVIEAKGLRCSNPDVVAYVTRLRTRFERQNNFKVQSLQALWGEHDESPAILCHWFDIQHRYRACAGRTSCAERNFHFNRRRHGEAAASCAWVHDFGEAARSSQFGCDR